MNMDADTYCELWVIKHRDDVLSYIDEYLKLKQDKEDKGRPSKKKGVKIFLGDQEEKDIDRLKKEIAGLKTDDYNKRKLSNRGLLRSIIEKGLCRDELDKYIW